MFHALIGSVNLMFLKAYFRVLLHRPSFRCESRLKGGRTHPTFCSKSPWCLVISSKLQGNKACPRDSGRLIPMCTALEIRLVQLRGISITVEFDFISALFQEVVGTAVFVFFFGLQEIQLKRGIILGKRLYRYEIYQIS